MSVDADRSRTEIRMFETFFRGYLVGLCVRLLTDSMRD